ncbi:lysophospholipid acyltransferase family protein [Mycoplasma sp. 6243]|uniref:lysophospholipid acyltransferase family protein n=1 Tax=Mycoplasma sp. 6243 TaxID=3440865 RepID=UPI003EBCD935
MKFTIDTRIKFLATCLAWLRRWLKLGSMLRKYKKTPELVSREQRYKFILKIAKKLIKIYNIDLAIEGIENIPNNGGIILTPNHKSYIDALVLIAALEQTNQEFIDKPRVPTFIGKEGLKKSKTIYKSMQLLDSFFIDNKNIRDSLRTLDEFTDFVKNQKTFGIVFPEGTRIKEEKLGDFKSGIYKMANNTYMDVIPVAISNTLDAFSLKRHGRIKVTVSFLTTLKAKTNITKEPAIIATKAKDMIAAKLGYTDEIKK